MNKLFVTLLITGLSFAASVRAEESLESVSRAIVSLPCHYCNVTYPSPIDTAGWRCGGGFIAESPSDHEKVLKLCATRARLKAQSIEHRDDRSVKNYPVNIRTDEERARLDNERREHEKRSRLENQLLIQDERSRHYDARNPRNDDRRDHNRVASNSPARCYWMENQSKQFRWVRAPNAPSKNACFRLDSCNGGRGKSKGGCYKWATGPDAPRMRW